MSRFSGQSLGRLSASDADLSTLPQPTPTSPTVDSVASASQERTETHCNGQDVRCLSRSTLLRIRPLIFLPPQRRLPLRFVHLAHAFGTRFGTDCSLSHPLGTMGECLLHSALAHSWTVANLAPLSLLSLSFPPCRLVVDNPQTSYLLPLPP